MKYRKLNDDEEVQVHDEISAKSNLAMFVPESMTEEAYFQADGRGWLKLPSVADFPVGYKPSEIPSLFVRRPIFPNEN